MNKIRITISGSKPESIDVTKLEQVYDYLANNGAGVQLYKYDGKYYKVKSKDCFNASVIGMDLVEYKNKPTVVDFDWFWNLKSIKGRKDNYKVALENIDAELIRAIYMSKKIHDEIEYRKVDLKNSQDYAHKLRKERERIVEWMADLKADNIATTTM